MIDLLSDTYFCCMWFAALRLFGMFSSKLYELCLGKRNGREARALKANCKITGKLWCIRVKYSFKKHNAGCNQRELVFHGNRASWNTLNTPRLRNIINSGKYRSETWRIGLLVKLWCAVWLFYWFLAELCFMHNRILYITYRNWAFPSVLHRPFWSRSAYD